MASHGVSPVGLAIREKPSMVPPIVEGSEESAQATAENTEDFPFAAHCLLGQQTFSATCSAEPTPIVTFVNGSSRPPAAGNAVRHQTSNHAPARVAWVSPTHPFLAVSSSNRHMPGLTFPEPARNVSLPAPNRDSSLRNYDVK